MIVSSRRALGTAISACALVAATLPGIAPALASTGAILPGTALGGPKPQLVGSAVNPDATFSCQTTTPAACYGPAQIRAAYGVDQLTKFHLDGTGRSITIIDAYQSPTISSDLSAFDTLFGLPAPQLNIIAPDGLTPFDQSSTDQTSWAGEISLDVEYAHAIAPGATINLVLAKSDQDADIYSAQKYVVDNNLGDTITQSFGEAEQCMDPSIFAASHALFARASAQGQTVFASSADQGAALPTCDGTSFFKAVSTPASDTNVTAVGGTLLDADGTTGAYHGETTWNEPDFAAAGGGGVSVMVKRPVYQNLFNHTGNFRTVPDVSYNAGINTGVLAVWSSSGQGANLVFRFGGTSAGSPQWAGLVALADQLSHRRAGAINTALYTASITKTSYNTLFHDITTGDNTYHGDVTIQGYAAGTGYDLATGLGTPKAQYIVPTLALTSYASLLSTLGGK